MTGYFDALDIRWNFLDMRLIIYISYVKENMEAFLYILNQAAICIHVVQCILLMCVVYCRLNVVIKCYTIYFKFKILIYIYFCNSQVLGAIITALQLSQQRMARFLTIAWWQMLQPSSEEPLIFLVKYVT